MKIEQIKDYCLSKWKAYEDYPFGDIPICYKINKKIFAQLYPFTEDYKITLKCTADAGQFYRQVYPGKVVRGYHCPPVQQPYWNTVYLDGFSDKELLNMIDHAYDTVLHSFSKKVQKQIMTVDEILIRPMRKEEYNIEDFGKPTDVWLVTESGGILLGAVWSRILAEGVKGYGNIDEITPEFAISVKKEFRGQGIGMKLMQKMIFLLKSRGVKKASLSVNRENYAYQMYCKLGFQVEEAKGDDYLMVLDMEMN